MLIGITATGMEVGGMVDTGIQVIGTLAQWSSWRRISTSLERREDQEILGPVGEPILAVSHGDPSPKGLEDAAQGFNP
jgi:hypothetical protein